MGSGIDIRIDPQRNWRLHSLAAGDFIQVSKFRFALDVETEDALVECILDFLPRLADSGEGAFLRIAAGREHAEKLAPRDDVEARAFTRKQIEDGAVRVRLNGVADQVVDPSEGRVEPAIVIENGARAVDVERRSIFLRDARKVHGFAMQAAVKIMERVHGSGCVGGEMAQTGNDVIPSRADGEGPRKRSFASAICHAFTSGCGYIFKPAQSTSARFLAVCAARNDKHSSTRVPR